MHVALSADLRTPLANACLVDILGQMRDLATLSQHRLWPTCNLLANIYKNSIHGNSSKCYSWCCLTNQNLVQESAYIRFHESQSKLGTYPGLTVKDSRCTRVADCVCGHNVTRLQFRILSRGEMRMKQRSSAIVRLKGLTSRNALLERAGTDNLN